MIAAALSCLATALALSQGPAAPAVPSAAAGATPTAPEGSALPFQARVEKAEVQLGQPFGYQIEVRHAPGVTVSLPATLPSGAFRMEPGKCRREEAEAEVVTTCSIRLALFALGPNDVPEIGLVVNGPGGASTLAVPGPRVTAQGLLDPNAPPEKLALRDLAPTSPLMVRTLRLVWWTLGALAALAIAAAGWSAWRAARRRPVEAPPPLPPHERLERRLDQLEADRLGERGQSRAHFYRLSEIVREYLGALLGLPALDLTTEEIVAALGAARDPRLEPGWLRPFLEQTDLVKFARSPAGASECTAGVAFARSLLERTRPVETGPAEEPPAGPEGRRR